MTRCHSASSCFLLFFRFRKVLKEIFSELDGTKSSDLTISSRTRSPKGRRRGATRWPHHRVARAHLLARHRMVWAPRVPSDAALSPIYCPQRIKPRGTRHIPQKYPQRRRHRRQVSGDRSLCSGTLPGRGSAPGAISIDSGSHDHRLHLHPHRRC